MLKEKEEKEEEQKQDKQVTDFIVRTFALTWIISVMSSGFYSSTKYKCTITSSCMNIYHSMCTVHMSIP